MKASDVFLGLVSALGLSLLGFASSQVYQMKAEMAVVSYKVDENHKMIRPMWQDWISQASSDGSIKGPNSDSSILISDRLDQDGQAWTLE